MKHSNFVARIENFEEAYWDMLTINSQFVAKIWMFRQASKILSPLLRLDSKQALSILLLRGYAIGSEWGLRLEGVIFFKYFWSTTQSIWKRESTTLALASIDRGFLRSLHYQYTF